MKKQVQIKFTDFIGDNFVCSAIANNIVVVIIIIIGVVVVVVINMVIICRIKAQFVYIYHMRGLYMHHQIPWTDEIIFAKCAQEFC